MKQVTDILKNRGPIYGNPLLNLSITEQFYQIYSQGNDLRNKVGICNIEQADVSVGTAMDRYYAHTAAMKMVLTKIARIATGTFHEDNYLDAMGYLEIARKLAKGVSTDPKDIGKEE